MVCVRGWVLKIDRIRGETSREGVGANVRNRAERRRSKRRKRERERMAEEICERERMPISRTRDTVSFVHRFQQSIKHFFRMSASGLRLFIKYFVVVHAQLIKL